MPSALAQSFRIDPADLPSEAVIFGSTAAMREVRAKIDSLLHNDLPVLIQGESGTGKESVARYLHSRSDRRNEPFVKLNCAATPAGRLEGALLGYEKGAFPGASESKRGLVEIAGGGTLFITEVGEMDRSLQAKLLRLLQDGRYARVGAGEERQSHARIISATNIDLETAVKARAFGQDLLYRLDAIGLQLSPLRKRTEDIPQLCEYFMRKLAERFGKVAPQLTPAAVQLLEQWNWPGNLPELENWIARAMILGGEDDLSDGLRRQMALANISGRPKPRIVGLEEAPRLAASAASRVTALRVLQGNHSIRRKTAVKLDIGYSSLLYKLHGAGVPRRRRNRREILPPK
jgi:transcriptional regulator with PAS, ATPase and Fis domain